jgi:hypothetical protein
MAEPGALLYKVIKTVDEINHLAMGLLGSEKSLFFPPSLTYPPFEPAEMGFFRSVSWLFTLYSEVGSISIKYLVDQFDAFDLVRDGSIARHPQIVQKLRTFTQHHLDYQKAHDKGIKDDCEKWIEDQCGSKVPGKEEQWAQCLESLLTQAVEFLQALLEVVRRIESDEAREEMCRQWQVRLTRYHAPYEFDEVVSRVAADIGREALDVVKFRKRHYDHWMHELNELELGYDFQSEARRLVEYALLTERAGAPPLDGTVIMAEFGIGPGPQLGDILNFALLSYGANPCNREVLLTRIKEKYFT